MGVQINRESMNYPFCLAKWLSGRKLRYSILYTKINPISIKDLNKMTNAPKENIGKDSWTMIGEEPKCMNLKVKTNIERWIDLTI